MWGVAITVALIVAFIAVAVFAVERAKQARVRRAAEEPPTDRPVWDEEHRVWEPERTLDVDPLRTLSGASLVAPFDEPEDLNHPPDRPAWDAEHRLWVPDWTPDQKTKP